MEGVAIIGGSIGGLAVALSLKGTGRNVVVIERDPEPPSISPEAAFDVWSRPGVPQFRHPHIFLARLYTAVRDRHPELLAELLDAGFDLSTLEEVLPAGMRDRFPSASGDRDLLHLWGRRATFEYVLRRHVGRLPHVRFLHSARATGLVTEIVDSQIRVRGVEISRSGITETVEADVVVDASGKRSRCPEWLIAKGANVTVDRKESGFVYSCRNYRLNDPAASPPRLDGGGNLDYLGFTTFYAERGNFALTFGCPVDEDVLARTIRREEGFESLCSELPVLKHWRAESMPTSKVLGAGRFENRWTEYGSTKGFEVLGFFAAGDAHVETNPMYGRGCASAFVQAEVLVESLASTSDPLRRARFYAARTRNLLLPFFDMSVATDRLYRSRAKLARGLDVPFGDRFISAAFDAAWLPAVNSSPLVAREFVKAMQMREISSIALRLAVLVHILWAWLSGLLQKTRAGATVHVPRNELLGRLSANRDRVLSA